jgi:carnitine O-acetyltransferase
MDRMKILPNWLYEYTLENKSLSKRDPLPIKNNYYLLFDFFFKNQSEAVAKIILCCVLLKRITKDNTKISQITNKDFNQYYLLFHSCRSPGNEKDKLSLYDFSDNKNVIIIYKNVFWVLEATLDYDKICDQINYITSIDLVDAKDNYIGILTASDRNSWSQYKEKFIHLSDKNKMFLYYIESCEVLFSLEDQSSTDLMLKEMNKLCWFGDGQNKYFDKLLQFIVLKDGYVAMNVQRDLIDQSICIEFAKLIKQWTSDNDVTGITKKVESNVNYFENFSYKPIKLNYDLDENLKKAINKAYGNLENIKKDFKTEFMFFNEYGKELLDRRGLATESYIQLAILAAYYRTFNKVPPSRQFVCGRNFSFAVSEWIRTTTKEASNFSVAINEMKVPRDLKIKIGLDAFKQHKNNTSEVNSGKSIDTHFTGLISVMKPDESLPPFFEDEMYSKSSQYIIDTYPIFHEFVKLCANPPPCQDGVSITYIIRKGHIQFVGCAFYDLQKYFQSLIEVMREMKDLFIEKEREFYIRPKF